MEKTISMIEEDRSGFKITLMPFFEKLYFDTSTKAGEAKLCMFLFPFFNLEEKRKGRMNIEDAIGRTANI